MWINYFCRQYESPWTYSKYQDVSLRLGLHATFDSWEEIVARRDEIAPRDHRVRMRMPGYSPVYFSLDALLPEEQEWFDKDSEKPFEEGFLDQKFNDLSPFHYIFFRPKNGVHKDVIFRFTIAEKYPTGVDLLGPVTLSFVHLLLAGSCDFSDITFLQGEGSHPHSAFPQLPLKELLPRADSFEFIRINFDQNSCEAIGSSSSKLEKLSFTGCSFADGGSGVAQALATSPKLTSLEWETLRDQNSTISENALYPLLKTRTSNLNLKSLMLTLSDLGSGSAVRHLSGSMPLEALHIGGRGMHLEQKEWKSFLTCTIKRHPTLKTLVLDSIPREYVIPVLQMVKCRAISCLESVVAHETVTSNIIVIEDAERKIFDEINAVLKERAQCRALQQSSYRHALLAGALHASEIASRPDFAFALLKANVDVVKSY